MTWDLLEKSGDAVGGWDYNEPNLAYDDDEDPDTGSSVTYNNLGADGTWTNINKT